MKKQQYSCLHAHCLLGGILLRNRGPVFFSYSIMAALNNFSKFRMIKIAVLFLLAGGLSVFAKV